VLCSFTFRSLVFKIPTTLARVQPRDIRGISDYGSIDACGGIQWPLADGESESAGERRLFADGRFFTTGERARFIFQSPRPAPEQPTSEFPLILLTGRGSSAQWH